VPSLPSVSMKALALRHFLVRCNDHGSMGFDRLILCVIRSTGNSIELVV
jgi:hypothetical protein